MTFIKAVIDKCQLLVSGKSTLHDFSCRKTLFSGIVNQTKICFLMDS